VLSRFDWRLKDRGRGGPFADGPIGVVTKLDPNDPTPSEALGRDHSYQTNMGPRRRNRRTNGVRPDPRHRGTFD